MLPTGAQDVPHCGCGRPWLCALRDVDRSLHGVVIEAHARFAVRPFKLAEWMVIPLVDPLLPDVLLPLLPTCPCGIFQQVLSVGRLQQIAQPAQAPHVVGLQETRLGGKVRKQQLVHQIDQVGAGMAARQPLVLLEPVDERSENLRLLFGNLVDEMKNSLTAAVSSS